MNVATGTVESSWEPLLHGYASQEAPTDDVLGGRFRIGRVLGTGGTSTVYRATDSATKNTRSLCSLADGVVGKGG